MREIFGTKDSGGLPFREIVSRAFGRFADGDEKEALTTLHTAVEARDHAPSSGDVALRYRDFFVTPDTESLNDVLVAVTSNNQTLIDGISEALDAAKDYFKLPMLLLPDDHDPELCKLVLDGWPKERVVAAGVLATFENEDTLTSVLDQVPDYSRRRIPWRWRAHLLGLTNRLGMTVESGGNKTNYGNLYSGRIEAVDASGNRLVLATAGGADQCAYRTPTGGWDCQALLQSKCSLVGGQPTEATDLCAPPSGS